MIRPSARGESLIELVVALVLLELVGAFALGAALASDSARRHADRAAAADATRWADYRIAETALSCVAAPAPVAVPFLLPAAAVRPALATTLLCGH